MKKQNSALHFVIVSLISILFVGTAYAKMPDKPCSALSETDQQKFYELTGQGVEAAANDPDSAINLLKKAMYICNDDYYTEYSLARVYQQAGQCPAAYFHFERLLERESSIDDREIKKALRKHSATVKETCPNVADLSIECKMPGTQLTISGPSNITQECPIYTKIIPGTYSVLAKKADFFDYKSSFSAEDGGVVQVNIPNLSSLKNVGSLRVFCPKGATKFALTNKNGISNEYACPWEGELDAGIYKINLVGQSEDKSAEVEVIPQELSQHRIPSTVSGACSMSQIHHQNNATYALVLWMLSIAGVVLWRRRRMESKG